MACFVDNAVLRSHRLVGLVAGCQSRKIPRHDRVKVDGGGLVESHGSKWLNIGPRGNGGFCPATELILVETKLIFVSVGGSLGYIEVDYGGAASPRSCLFYVTGWRHFWDRSYLCSG